MPLAVENMRFSAASVSTQSWRRPIGYARLPLRSLVRARGDTMTAHSQLVVVGSVNADLVVSCDRVPAAGETLAATSLELHPGGKGANQAAAASLLGCPTQFIGQVGSDSNAVFLRDCLSKRGVDLSLLRAVEGPSGTAIVMLEKTTGENRIIIVGGANTNDFSLSDAQRGAIAGAGMVLLQREVPGKVNMEVARVAAAAGVPVLLDAGGEDAALPEDIYPLIDTLSPNETELSRLTGMPVGEEEAAAEAAQVLLGRGVRRVLVKMGAAGSILLERGAEGLVRQAAIPATAVVDTTGAGDSFTAGYAVGILEGMPPGDAMRLGAAVASIVVGRIGAMSSLPSRKEVDALLRA